MWVAVGVGVWVAVGVGVSVGVCVAVGVGEAVAVGVQVAVGVGVAVCVGVGDGVWVGVIVGIASMACAAIWATERSAATSVSGVAVREYAALIRSAARGNANMINHRELGLCRKACLTCNVSRSPKDSATVGNCQMYIAHSIFDTLCFSWYNRSWLDGGTVAGQLSLEELPDSQSCIPAAGNPTWERDTVASRNGK